jgi:hypothetical protein
MTSDLAAEPPSGLSAPPPDRLPVVAIISASIGAGHDGAAHELARRLVIAGYAACARPAEETLKTGHPRPPELALATTHGTRLSASRRHVTIQA